MLQSQRQAELYQYLKRKKTGSVQQFCKRFYASEATIRRDLAQLEAKGLIRRIRGGAAFVEEGGGEVSAVLREHSLVEQKRVIGELASYFIRDGYRVIFGFQFPAYHAAGFFGQFRDLCVITSGLRAALWL